MQLVKSLDGVVHSISPVNNEFTLCGIAEEGACSPDKLDPKTCEVIKVDPDNLSSWTRIEKAKIDCPHCKLIIDYCRGKRGHK